MNSLRWLSTLQLRQQRIGIALATGVILCSSLNLIQDSLVFPTRDAFSQERASVQRELESKEGSHVVLVRYADNHPPIQEWVYNHADIDASKVVWARHMSDVENRQLFDYFKGRSFWLLEPDAAPPHLKPLSAGVEKNALGTVSRSNDPAPIHEMRIQWP
jgi:hypothetical protein